LQGTSFGVSLPLQCISAAAEEGGTRGEGRLFFADMK
jgi:hypothetical protein